MRRYVSESIRKMREAQGMSVEQVCKLTGLTPERLKAYEEGSSVPPIGVMISLSRVLGSKMERLLHGGGVVSESLTICRNGESHAGIQGNTEQSYAYASLTRPGTAGHLMEPFLLDFDPAAPPGPACSSACSSACASSARSGRCGKTVSRVAATLCWRSISGQ